MIEEHDEKRPGYLLGQQAAITDGGACFCHIAVWAIQVRLRGFAKMAWPIADEISRAARSAAS